MLWQQVEGEYRVGTFMGIDYSEVDFAAVGKTACPACQEEGRDRHGDNLHVYGLDDDGKPLGAKCFSCGTEIYSYDIAVELEKSKSSESSKEKGNGHKVKAERMNTEVKDKAQKKATQVEIAKLQEKRLTDEQLNDILENTGTDPKGYRGIQKDVSERYDVRYEYNTSNGKVNKMLVPAYIQEDGVWKITGFKVREGGKEFYSIGYVGILNAFMGQHNATPNKFLMFVGGEIDCLTAAAFLEGTSKYKAGYTVVCSLTGEASTFNFIRRNYEFTERYKFYVLGLDNDEAGKDATTECLNVLDRDVTYLAKYRDKYKDPNDYFEKGKVNRADAQENFLQDVHWGKQLEKSYGIVGSRSLLAAAIKNVMRPKIPLPKFLRDLDDFFVDGIGLGEIFNIISNTSTGKSVYVNEMIADWIVTAPYKICILSLEDNQGSYGVKIASRILGQKIHRIKGAENRAKVLMDNEDKILEFLSDKDGDDAFYLIEETFSDLEDIKKSILQAIKVYQCKIIIIDPLVNLISTKSQEEQIAFMLFEEDCRRVYDVTFVNVCHTRKTQQGGKAASRGGEQNEEDVKGTSQITGSGTINMIIRRDKLSECPIIRNTTFIDITKNRTDGKTQSNAAKIFYHEESHTLIPYSIAENNDFFRERRVDFNTFGVTPVTTTDLNEDQLESEPVNFGEA